MIGRRLAFIVAGLILAACLWATLTPSGQLLTGRWIFTEKAFVDRGTYFRLKVDVTYRGEPQHFDIVVGCNVAGIEYKDGSSTREVGLVPTVYGRRMSDGKGLVVRAPDACHGETTTDGSVPSDFMPVMVIYDDADTLGFGTAYMVDEAYDSPHSLMVFGKASVEKATRPEFDDFRKNGQPNLVRREQYHSAQPTDVVEKMGLKKVYPAFGRSCWAFSRSLVPDELRGRIRELWPASRPKYWRISDERSRSQLIEVARTLTFERDDGFPLKKGMSRLVDAEWAGDGAMHAQGSRRIGPTDLSITRTPTFYPADSDVSASNWPRDPLTWPEYISRMRTVNVWNIKVETGLKGFVYCFQPPSFSSNGGAIEELKGLDATFTVDEKQIEGAPRSWSLGSGQLPDLFEEDQFYYEFNNFYLESTGGDV